MKDTTVCIIPIYNEEPTPNEVRSIVRNISVLNEFDVYFVHPLGMNTSRYREYKNAKFIAFDDKYFVSNKTYSRLLLSEMFYKQFGEYNYMLIAQTDTYIINTNYTLKYFTDMNYDYYGAPWPHGPFDRPYGIKEIIKSLFVHKASELHVGNGGFSLRKVENSRKLISNHKVYIKFLFRLNEDLFFSVYGRKKKEYISCPYEIAMQFALEKNMQEELTRGNVPFAVHAWEKYLSSDMQIKIIK